MRISESGIYNRCADGALVGGGGSVADLETEAFNWLDENCVVVESVAAIAVYSNPKGGIVIRQEGIHQDDSFVVIPRDRVADLIAALRKEAGIPE